MIVDELTGLREVARRHPRLALYVFGSTVHGPEAPIDLDVLAVYEAIEDYEAFRLDLDRLAFAPVVDLVAMTPTELHGSGFLHRSRAVALSEAERFRRESVSHSSPLGRAEPDCAVPALSSSEGYEGMHSTFDVASLGRWDSDEGAFVIDTIELGLPQASQGDVTQATALIGEWRRGLLALDPPEDIPLSVIDASIQGVLRREPLEHYLSDRGGTFAKEPSSWGAEGPLAVELIDGRTVLVDGNHRWAAAKIRDDATFRAQILRPGTSFSTDTDWSAMQSYQLIERYRRRAVGGARMRTDGTAKSIACKDA
jgi:hypothetical protein